VRPPVGRHGLALITAPDLVEATADTGVFVQLSGVLKRCAVKLSKICNDLRLLSSGPRAGFGEINLPPMQPGSSIMPGKVNPVIPEVVNQVCFDDHRRRRDGDDGRRGGAAAAQRVRAGSSPTACCAASRACATRACVLRERLRRRHHGEPRPHALVRRALDRHRHLRSCRSSATSVASEIAKDALASGRGVYELVPSAGS
jgi:aspartate ammonia-lyase